MRVRRLLRILLVGIAALALILVGANAWVWARGSALERDSIDALAPAPVAIVLGAGMRRDGEPSDALADRLEQALALYRAGKARKLLLSGDHGTPEYDETNGMRRWMVARGVPDADVFCDHAGFSTHDSLARARQVFGVERAIVVTQAFHLPRALYTAQACGIAAEGAPCDRRTYRGALWFALREAGSRVKALVQSGILHLAPRVGGAPIDIRADGRASWDDR